MKKLLFIGLLLFSSPAFATAIGCKSVVGRTWNLVWNNAPHEVIMSEYKFYASKYVTEEEFEYVVWYVWDMAIRWRAFEGNEPRSFLRDFKDIERRLNDDCETKWSDLYKVFE